MHLADLHPGNSNTKQWPDFYSILESSPEIDSETLRRSINALYVKANEQSDHRELNTRFYNQVLTQKVLPQCRRILLNEDSRQAYDKQWHLHREGAESALSYQDFIREIAKDAGTARALLLSDDEISLLPSFGTAPPATGVAVAASIDTNNASASSEKNASNAVSSNTSVAAPAPKKFPVVPLVVGLLALAGGGFALNSSRQQPAPDAASTTVSTAPSTAVSKPVATPIPADAPLMKLNSLAANTDFESGQSGWISTDLKSGFPGVAYQHDAKSGASMLTFWNSKACSATVSQTIKGLKPGKYTLRAWTRRGGGQTQSEMFAENYGGPKRTALMLYGWSYILTTIKDIEVKSGKCTIGFTVKSPANKTTNVDAVEFFRQ